MFCGVMSLLSCLPGSTGATQTIGLRIHSKPKLRT